MVLNHYDNVVWNTIYKEPYFTQELILMHYGNKEHV